jgi:hypothetical protein
MTMDSAEVALAGTATTAVEGHRARHGRLLLGLSLGWLALVVVLAATASWLPLKSYSLIFDTPNKTPGVRFPEVLGFQKDLLHHTFIVPP